MAFTFTDENVNELITSGQPLVVDCWATWCGPCVAMSPIIDDLAKEYEGRALIGKYNIEDEGDLSGEYRIMSIPTILFFKDGKVVNRLTGSQSRQTLEDKIKELIG